MGFKKEEKIYCKYCGLELEKDKCTCIKFLHLENPLSTKKREVATIKCDTCHKKIDMDSAFCPYCGVPVNAREYEKRLQRELKGEFEPDVLADIKKPLMSPLTKKVLYIVTSVVMLLCVVRIALILKENYDIKKEQKYLESIKAETSETYETYATVPQLETYNIDETEQPVIPEHTNWIRQNGYIYCLNKEGDPIIDDWVEEIDEHGNSNMYYFDIDGRLVVNSWIDGEYYVGPDGAMFLDRLTPDGAYVDEDGKIVIDDTHRAVSVEKETRIYYESPNEGAVKKISNQKSSSAGVIKGVDATKTYELYIQDIRAMRGNFVSGEKKCNYTYYYPVIKGGSEKEVNRINMRVEEMFTDRFLNVITGITDEDGKVPKSIILNTVDQRQINANRFVFILSGKLVTEKEGTEKKKYRFIYDRKSKELTMLDISKY